MISRQDTDAMSVAVEAKRKRAGIALCPACGELVPQDFSCSNCGIVYSLQGLVDELIALKVRKPDDFVA